MIAGNVMVQVLTVGVKPVWFAVEKATLTKIVSITMIRYKDAERVLNGCDFQWYLDREKFWISSLDSKFSFESSLKDIKGVSELRSILEKLNG